MCEESEECKALADPKTWKNASYASCKCSGHSNAANKNGPYVLAPNLEIVDSVKIPAGLKPGDCERHAASLLVADLCPPCRLLTLRPLGVLADVLQWRWDCEETAQVWESCADVTITA